ncbi:hypothetical protein GOP47_0027569 [Adiantum capillus-veneris]|nr:hypothetical protein GOP47_0027569 [Adiantum capillus-veneris]
MKNTHVIKCTVRYLNENLLEIVTHMFNDLFANSVNLQLVSEVVDPDTDTGKVSAVSKLRLWGSKDEGPDSLLTISFKVDEDFGKPAAILLESFYSNEFYIKSITLTLQDSSTVYFPCHTWINHTRLYFGKPRVFFSNQPLLPSETPPAILKLRDDELLALRGDGKGQRVHGQRVYDYDVYHDLSNPDSSPDLARPILGGSSQYPYPRRCRTGRTHTKADPLSESPETSFDGTYVPRDDRFSASKKMQFIGAGARSLGHNVISTLESLIMDDRSFEALEQIHDLYVGDLQATYGSTATPVIRKPTDGTPLEFPPPGVVEANKEAWKTDHEFGRQRLVGINPVVIQCLKDFPPKSSSLDPEIYGQPTSSITFHHIEPLLEGLSVKKALEHKRLYILDYHDALMPFISRINDLGIGKAYASRTIFYLNKAGTLLPIAIEATLPPVQKGEKANSRVFTPNDHLWLWRLAKIHVAIIDTGYHQLVSHWLRTHACVEPFVIATRRQLSAMHPLHVLLSPHFKDTMHINALARSSLINAGGKIESHYTPGKYCMEVSSAAYKSWQFDEEALPKDLLKRGMAVEDSSAKHGVRLTIEDYPYAVDGLDLWGAIEQWVDDYVKLYYNDDKAVQDDVELQRWWEEVVKVGHGDHAEAEWWSKMTKVEDVIQVMSTLIWMASALHAAVNFGQYAYGGYMPNRPCTARLLIPEEGTPEYAGMLTNPRRFFLDTVPTQGATTFAMAVLEILAQHMSEEEYLGERKDVQWTCDARATGALEKFRRNLEEVETSIECRNADETLHHHRLGPANLPYTLLAPSSAGPGLTFRGVPNSISI